MNLHFADPFSDDGRATAPFRHSPGPALSVAILEARALPAIEEAIRALEGRAAEGNAFAGADFLLAAIRHFPASAAPEFVAVWRETIPPRLAGLIPIVRRRPRRPDAILRSWLHPLMGAGAPLIDADDAVAVMRAALAGLRRLPGSPAAFCLAGLAEDGPVARATREAAAALGLGCAAIGAFRRAALHPGDAAPQGRREKERRRQHRRLSERGALGFRVAEGYDAVRPALEAFLALEARGWKGGAGTALLHDPALANFARAMVWSAARRGQARIALLELDGSPVAATILLNAGRRGFLWKIAHDEAHDACSPGVLLVRALSSWIAGLGGAGTVDSCAIPGHRMIEGLWSGRIAIIDLMIGLSPGRAAPYRAALTRERWRRALRGRVKAVYHRLRRGLRRGG